MSMDTQSMSPPGRSRHQNWYLVTGAMIGLVVATTLVKLGMGGAVALVILPAAGVVLLRSWGGLVLGIVMILAIPAWYTLGSAQLNVTRVASLLAAGSGVIAFAKGQRVSVRATDVALGAYLLIVVLGWVLEDQHAHVSHVVTAEFSPLGFYIGARTVPAARARFVILAMLGAATVGAITVLYEVTRGHVIFTNPQTYGLWAGGSGFVFRPGGVFGNPPQAATTLGFVVVLGVAWLRLASGRYRVLVLAFLVICSVALVLTFTRASMIGVGAGIVVFLLLTRPMALRPLRLAWLVVVIAAVVPVVIPELRGTTFQQGVSRSGTLASRENVWQLAWPMARSSIGSFMFGHGTGILEAPFVTNAIAIPQDIATSPLTYTLGIQNQYLQGLVENGAIGVIALLALFATGITPAVRSARATRDPVSAALASAITGLMVVMLANTALYSHPVFALLLVALGLASNCGDVRRKRDTSGRVARREMRGTRARAALS